MADRDQSDLLLRRTWAVSRRPACAQVSGQVGISASNRECPASTGRSGTQRARRLRSRTTVGAPAPWFSSPPSELRITGVFWCVARGLKPRASFGFTGCCWWRPLAVDGGSGTSGGHAWSAPVMRRPGARRRRATARLIDTGRK